MTEPPKPPAASEPDLEREPEGKEEEPASSEEPTLGEDAPDSLAMRALLQRSLPQAPSVEPDAILHDVQRTIRKRSRGKFYGDGWSTSQARTGYALGATAIVLVIALAWFAMAPGGLFGR